MNHQAEVLYNAGCPICGREVRHYECLSDAADVPIRYDDLNDPEDLSRWSVSAEAAAKRLHVRKNGQVYAGLPAFIALWEEIPRTRWLARIFSIPGLHGAAAALYDHGLAPSLYRLHLRREHK